MWERPRVELPPFFFVNDTATTEIYTLSLHDALPVWHGGPFSRYPQFRFYPKEIVFGTDPVAIDRILLDIIENKRKAEGAVSIWDRSLDNVKRGRDDDPRANHYIREPGHIEYASRLGLGVYDISRIHVTSIEV